MSRLTMRPARTTQCRRSHSISSAAALIYRQTGPGRSACPISSLRKGRDPVAAVIAFPGFLASESRETGGFAALLGTRNNNRILQLALKFYY